MTYYHKCTCMLGVLTIVERDGLISEIRFGDSYEAMWTMKETDIILWAEKELKEYFKGERKVFSFPHRAFGTDFQCRVWKALEEIPYGEVRSYKEVAVMAGSPKACRAVGMANHKNPLPIVVPCHRVIGSNGKLTGYAGGLDIKRHLLELEREFAP